MGQFAKKKRKKDESWQSGGIYSLSWQRKQSENGTLSGNLKASVELNRSLHSDSTTSAPNQRLKATPQHISDAFSQTQSLLSRAPPEVSLAGCVPLLMKLTKFYVFAFSEPEVKPPLFHWSQPAVVLGGGRPLPPTAGVDSTWPDVCLPTHCCSQWSHDGVWLWGRATSESADRQRCIIIVYDSLVGSLLWRQFDIILWWQKIIALKLGVSGIIIEFKVSLSPTSRGTRSASDVRNVARAWSRPLRLRKMERSTAKVRSGIWLAYHEVWNFIFHVLPSSCRYLVI